MRKPRRSGPPARKRAPKVRKPRTKVRVTRKVSKAKVKRMKNPKVVSPTEAADVPPEAAVVAADAPAPAPTAPGKSGNVTHDSNVLAAENTRQNAVAAATTQSAAKTADIAFYRTAKASALANGIGVAQFTFALQQLGTGGQ
jgi:hypothetical protein